MRRLLSFTIFVILYTSSFFLSAAQAITIQIQNSVPPEEPGAVLEVSQVKGIGVSANQRMLVMPGEKKRIYARHVTRFVLARVFGDYHLLYDVACPADVRIKDSLVIGLKEVATNRIGAGCELQRTGRWSLETGTTWSNKLSNKK